MKPHRIAWLIVLTFFISGILLANTADQPVEKPKEINKTEQCRNHPSHTYQVFVPSVSVSCKSLPLMIVVDPHGDGKLAVRQFKEAAQTYAVVLVASNRIKNNVSGYLQLLDELIADAKSKYPVGNTIFLSGFSGGARMTLDYAINHPVKGVIACGALAEPDQIKAISCPVMAIVGMDDFNFIEAAQFIIHPETIPKNLAIVTTEASHSWPGSSQLKQACGYLRLSSEENNSCIDANTLLKSFLDEQTSRLNSLTQSKDALDAMLLARNLSLSGRFDPAGSFRSRYEKMVKQEAFIHERDNLVTNLRLELTLRDQYYPALQEKDSTWWRNEVSALNNKLKTEGNHQKRMVYQRIKGFLGVACYSLCSRAANQNELTVLERVVPVYRILEPENPDQFYYSAVLAHLWKNSEKEKYYLGKAKEKGYQGSLSIP
jgi:dienelactone hydrolase